MGMPSAPKTEKPLGPIVGIVVIILILIVGGLYLWGQRLVEQTGLYPESSESLVPSAASGPDAQTEALQSQGASDSASAIEADLNATDVDNLTGELDQIGL